MTTPDPSGADAVASDAAPRTADAHAPARQVPLGDYREYPPAEMVERARNFNRTLQRRRTVRAFSHRDVPREIVEECLRAAGSAPSGAALQPWHFVAVSDASTKQRIRTAAEVEERDFYHRRAPQAWLDALAPLGTDEHKPFLEVAPWLIAIFEKTHSVLDDGRRVKNYYAPQSVGIACGMLIAAVHHAGLVSLTHTPSPMKFLNDILERPTHERPFLLLVVGYPAPDATVPDIARHALDRIATFR